MAQEPAEGISKYKESKGRTSTMKWYNIPCECGCDTSSTLMIDLDEHNMISATFCSTTKTKHWFERWYRDSDDNAVLAFIKSVYNDWYNRLAICWGALVHGYMQTESCVMLTKQQTLNVANTLNTVVKEYEMNVQESDKTRAAKAVQKPVAKPVVKPVSNPVSNTAAPKASQPRRRKPRNKIVNTQVPPKAN
jgi:hypothetical protein